MKISAVILTYNCAVSLKRCLASVKWANEIVIVDSGSTDNTLKIARDYKAKIYNHKLDGFANQRNWALLKTTSPWVLFIDSDEVVTPELAREIQAIISSGETAVHRVRRANYFFGQRVRYGGYWPDWQTRLFYRAQLKKYTGNIHESPQFTGPLKDLKGLINHYSHKSLSEGLVKSAHWTKVEAREFIKAGHPPITWWRLIKVMVWEFCYRYFKKMGFLDGFVGFVEAAVQAMNRFFVYEQIWELRHEDRSL